MMDTSNSDDRSTRRIKNLIDAVGVFSLLACVVFALLNFFEGVVESHDRLPTKLINIAIEAGWTFVAFVLYAVAFRAIVLRRSSWHLLPYAVWMVLCFVRALLVCVGLDHLLHVGRYRDKTLRQNAGAVTVSVACASAFAMGIANLVLFVLYRPVFKTHEQFQDRSSIDPTKTCIYNLPIASGNTKDPNARQQNQPTLSVEHLSLTDDQPNCRNVVAISYEPPDPAADHSQHIVKIFVRPNSDEKF